MWRPGRDAWRWAAATFGPTTFTRSQLGMRQKCSWELRRHIMFNFSQFQQACRHGFPLNAIKNTEHTHTAVYFVAFSVPFPSVCTCLCTYALSLLQLTGWERYCRCQSHAKEAPPPCNTHADSSPGRRARQQRRPGRAPVRRRGLLPSQKSPPVSPFTANCAVTE